MAALRQILRYVLNRLGFDIVRLRNSHGDLATHLKNVLDRNEVDCVIDVGGNKGQYDQMLRSIGYRGHIESFEPVRHVYDELKQNSSNDSKWTCHHCALGDKAELKTINVYSSSVFSSFLEANRYSKGIWKSLEDVQPEEVRVARLDQLYTDIVRRTGCQNILLKMDTQGYDRNVF